MLYYNKHEEGLNSLLDTLKSNRLYYEYVPDHTLLKDSDRLFFYAYIKWKINNFKNLDIPGVEKEIYYVFPDLRYEFKYVKRIWWFFPLFEIHYKDIITPELITFDYLSQKKINAYRVLQHKFPDIMIRIVEPQEVDNYKNFMRPKMEEGKDYINRYVQIRREYAKMKRGNNEQNSRF